MKIIKEGKRPDDRTHQWECVRCESIIESRACEGNISLDQRGGDFYRFKCPVCTYENHVAAKFFRGK